MSAAEPPTNPPGPNPQDVGPDSIASTWEADEPTSGPRPPAPRPWGPWATIGWTALCIGVMVAIQNAVFLIFLEIRSTSKPGANLTDLIKDLTTDGDLLAVAALLSSLAGVGLIGLLTYSRRYPIRDYLALSWPRARSAWAAVAGLVLLLVASDVTTYGLGRPITPPIMVDVYRTAWLPLLLIAVLVAAPLAEEMLFRGFLYRGIAASRAGPTVAILVSSVVWALLHISQYDWYAVVTILLTGLYLGYVRYRTGSVTLTILLHFLSNAIATLEVVLQDQGLI